MPPARRSSTAEDRAAARRALAASLFAADARVGTVAVRAGIARSTAYAWRQRWRGSRSLEPRRTGPRPRLGPAARLALARALLAAPQAAGLSGATWSLAAVAWWLEREAGVRYHRRHLGRLLRALGWTTPPVGAHSARARLALAARDLHGNPLELWLRPLTAGAGPEPARSGRAARPAGGTGAG